MPNKFSFETDFLEKQIQSSQIKAYITEGNFIDIGIPEDYFAASNILPKN
jgi:D-glycero-alpha-D-manno-heptose 1-phosphate guanylyltransferase